MSRLLKASTLVTLQRFRSILEVAHNAEALGISSKQLQNQMNNLWNRRLIDSERAEIGASKHGRTRHEAAQLMVNTMRMRENGAQSLFGKKGAIGGLYQADGIQGVGLAATVEDDDDPSAFSAAAGKFAAMMRSNKVGAGRCLHCKG